MAPPNLAADAPILNVFQPLGVNFFPVRRKEADKTIAHHAERLLRFRIAQKPLLAEARFNRHFAALAETDVVFVRLRFRKQFSLFQQLRCLMARFESVEPIQFRDRRTIDCSIRAQNIDNRQVVPLANFKIQSVMRGSDL